MKTLNLTNLEESDIKYEISKFPDGQQQVKITEEQSLSPYYSLINLLPWMIKEGVQIKSRLNNFKDLELIICATKSLRNLGVKEIHLYTPYFLGSRSDRKFEEGSNNYLKDVICPIINSLNFESVTVLDPHSDVLEACLNNFKKIDNFSLINYSIKNIAINKTKGESNKLNDFILISPDAGANKKIFKVAEQIGYTGEIITCSKDRDIDGKLNKTVVPIELKNNSFRYYVNKDFVIIDDICDGGRTFINIAIELKSYLKDIGSQGKIYLIVTHGIFSKGFEELSEYFDGIYCTNSYFDMPKNVIIPKKEFVKQLNVF